MISLLLFIFCKYKGNYEIEKEWRMKWKGNTTWNGRGVKNEVKGKIREGKWQMKHKDKIERVEREVMN